MKFLDGYRIVVVGASSGIGRSVGIQAARAGATVAFAARRVELLEDAVAREGEALPAGGGDGLGWLRAILKAIF